MDLFPLTNRNRIAGLAYPPLAFVLTLAVYWKTLCPTVYVGDSGEFITNAFTLGINHPTGYPLFTLLTRLSVILFPFWSAAVAVNFFSALCASLTVVFVYQILRLLTSRDFLAFAVSLLYGFSSTLWSRATSAEVYSLNSLFVALAILLLLRWYSRQTAVDLMALAYVVGLGLSQHATGALVVPSIALLIVAKQPRILLNVKLLVVLLAIGVAGFSSYLYLPIRSLADPPIDWGNPETLNNLVGHFFPRSASSLFGEFGGGFEDRVEWFLRQAFTREFWFFGLFALPGLALISRDWRLAVFVLSSTGVNVYFTIIRKLPLHADFDAYFLPSYIVMALLVCVALDWVWNALDRRWKRGGEQPVRLSVGATLLVLPLVMLKLNYTENDRSDNWFGYDFGMNVLSCVPQNAILFTVGDEQTFLSWYFKYVEKKRTDLTIIDQKMLGAVWGGSHMFNRDLGLPIDETKTPEILARQIVTASIDKRPIYFVPRVPWNFLTQEYGLWHTGMVVKLLPKGAPVPPYEPTEFTFHPNWTKPSFDERCKLIVRFYYKEFIDNARFWYGAGNGGAAAEEVKRFQEFPGPKDPDDVTVSHLMLVQVALDRGQYAQAMVAADSAEAHGPTDWRVHELKGNTSYLMKDTVAAIRSWKTSLAYNPGNEKLRHNVEILTRKAPVQFIPPALPQKPHK